MTVQTKPRATPEHIAEMIAARVGDTLAPLTIAMKAWPPDLRKIMWDAVSHEAALRAHGENADKENAK